MFFPTRFAIFEIKLSKIKKLLGPRPYYRTLITSVPVLDLATTHCLLQFDLQVFYIQQKCSYLQHLYSSPIPITCVLPLPTFHRGRRTQRCIHEECQMPDSQAHNWGINKKLQLFLVDEFQRWPKCDSVRRFGTFLESVCWIFSPCFSCNHRGVAVCWGISSEGQSNVIWEMDCWRCMHPQRITATWQVTKDT